MDTSVTREAQIKKIRELARELDAAFAVSIELNEQRRQLEKKRQVESKEHDEDIASIQADCKALEKSTACLLAFGDGVIKDMH